ncbi:hypothetical protein evm_001313 [Chilo suppressalis]|nr:hypothetical protein evm_001313 [Chilo suppressalis]
MAESDKLPLKRVELSLSKFNEVAIPHHLDLLRQHKANIIKYSENGDYGRVRSEQTHARRVSSQLRSLMAELESLRARVRVDDLPRFDRLTQRSRDDTLRAIVDYLGIIESSCKAIVIESKSQAHRRDTSPLAINRHWGDQESGVSGSAVSTESVGVVAHADPTVLEGVTQLQVHDQQEVSIAEREAVLRGWSELQHEVRALHEAWQHVHRAARQQGEQVSATASNVDVAADNVEMGRKDLAIAEKLRVGLYGAAGAGVGALVGGPAGMLAGAKVGAAAALAGSLLGYLAVRTIARPRALPAAREKDE